MIRLILKLAVVALLANATWHLFNLYSPHYRYVDSVRYAAQFRGAMSDDQLKEKVLSLAAQFDLPVTEDEVTATHDGQHTFVKVAYVQQVELAPGLTRQWPMTVDVDVLTMGDPKAPESPK